MGLNWEDMDFVASEFCTICGKRKSIMKRSYPPGICGIAFKFGCGHFMVDDCTPSRLGGTCFKGEESMMASICSLGFDEPNYSGRSLAKFLESERLKDIS